MKALSTFKLHPSLNFDQIAILANAIINLTRFLYDKLSRQFIVVHTYTIDR